MTGVLKAIYISPAGGVLPHAVERARVLAGRGIEGDRYALGTGTFSDRGAERDVTLIESEVLEAFGLEHGRPLTAAEARRNLVTQGLRLNELVHREFRIGGVRLAGLRLCEPCTHLARVACAQVLPGLVHRGGLYARVLDDGEICAGQEIIAPATAP